MESGLSQENRTKYAAVIRTLPNSPARNVLIDVMTMVGTVDNIDAFESMMNKLWPAVNWVLSERMPDPVKYPERIHEVTAICNVMRMMINDAMLSTLNEPSSVNDYKLRVNIASYLFIDRMIMKTIDVYEFHNKALKENDSIAIDCRNITEMYITCIATLLASYIGYKSERATKRMNTYKLIAKFAVQSYETSWTVISDEIDSYMSKMACASTLDTIYPDEIVPQMPITKTNDPESVLAFIELHGYPNWIVKDSFRNRIEHSLCPNHSAIIPEGCRVWLQKTPAIKSIILVPDKQSSDLYTVCRYEDGIYVLFIDPDTFQDTAEHYIISGMELVDDDAPNPPPRRKLRLTIPMTAKYRYVQDEL